MSEPSTSSVAKPGTACLGCRRRKLKCTREPEGCVACTKADFQCVYPVPETGVKRKRGPYKKDRPARERHLADLVKYLEPGASQSSASPESADQSYPKPLPESSPINQTDSISNNSVSPQTWPHKGATVAEDLVKDALIALTKSSLSNRESISERPHAGCTRQHVVPDRTATESTSDPLTPSIPRLMDYWHLFTTRVDPIIKVIHCPTLAKRIFANLENIGAMGPSTTVLLVSIYYAAVNSCTATEARQRFGESRDILMGRYARFVDNALADNYGVPSIEHLQALVIYMSVFRRKETGANVTALFSLAVRLAQIMGIDRESEKPLSPFETQMRRRLWWHICGLESRAAEEGGARATSIMETHNVKFPDNLNDIDLDPVATEPPRPRREVTDMTYTLGRWRIIRLIRSLWEIRRRYAGRDPDRMKVDQNKVFEEQKAEIDAHFFAHMSESRSYDWMCLRYMKAMLVKARIIIDHPLGQIPKKSTTKEERYRLLHTSVDIIRLTHVLASDPRIADWVWYFRGYMQWHALAVVVAELGQSTNKQFTQSAWTVVEPMLSNWDQTYHLKTGEPAWDHVNELIARARLMRQQAESMPQHTSFHAVDMTMSHSGPNTYAQTTMKSPSSSISPFSQAPGTYTTPSPHIPSQELNNAYAHPPPPPTYQGLPNTEIPTPIFEEIDFSAFDAVFGAAAWELPTTFDFNMNPGNMMNPIA